MIEALVHKYGWSEGITTRDNVLIEWPSSLGDKPTPSAIEVAVAEYAVYTKNNTPEPTDQEIALDHVLNSMTVAEKNQSKNRIKAK